jgi:hypothetical protein
LAIEEWALDGVRIVEVLSRVHSSRWLKKPFAAAKKQPPSSHLALRRDTQDYANGCPSPCDGKTLNENAARGWARS